jgi:hypothetical protein
MHFIFPYGESSEEESEMEDEMAALSSTTAYLAHFPSYAARAPGDHSSGQPLNVKVLALLVYKPTSGQFFRGIQMLTLNLSMNTVTCCCILHNFVRDSDGVE